MKKRIIGIDVARALAVIGMIIVNFKVVFGAQGDGWAKWFAIALEGKAAATFVVLAGVGLALMSNSAVRENNLDKLKTVRKRIAKRAIFLFVVGLSYIVIWPADILHFYGIYMLVVLFLLRKSNRAILFAALFMIFIYPFLIVYFDYEIGWDFNTLTYLDFWSFEGFFRNLFYNGFHPVIPWAAFMLIGLWFGRQDLNNNSFVKKAFWTSLVGFLLIQLMSRTTIWFFSEGDPIAAEEIAGLLGTSPMPPLPFYMLGGSCIAICVISACILIAKRFENNGIISALNKTGQLALTFYVAHVVIGMGVMEPLGPKQFGEYSVDFSVIYALVFSLLCILFAIFWTRFKKSGPLEWIMRKLTD